MLQKDQLISEKCSLDVATKKSSVKDFGKINLSWTVGVEAKKQGSKGI